MTKRLIIALYCAYSALNAAPTTPGTLDTTFDGDGKVTTPIGNNAASYSVAIQSDGKIVAAGDATVGTTGFALARYNTDGSLDLTFDTDGKVTTPIGTEAYTSSVAIQTDGKIVVSGRSKINAMAQFTLTVARYKSDGSLDNTFNPTGTPAGTQTTPIGTFASGQSVALQPDGKIIVAGYATDGPKKFALARYNTDGSLDTANFNSAGAGGAQAGTVITPIGTNAYGYAVALQTDGKIVVAGFTGALGARQFALARYNTDGSLDTTTFNTGGAQAGVQTTTIGTDAYGYAVALQPDGKIVVAGLTGATGARQFALARYNTDGSLDTTTFNPNGSGSGQAGTVITPIGTDAIGWSIAIQADGKIVVAGFSDTGTQDVFALARYDTNGTLDTTFNPTGTQQGVQTTTIGTYAQGYSVALQADGKIVVAGIATDGPNQFALARYNNIGALTGLYGTQQEVRYLAQGDLVNRLDWPAVTYATYYRIMANGQSFNSTLPNFEVHNVRPGNRIAYTISPFNASDEEGMPATITLGS